MTDIESKDHYSIELEKQKAEHDKMMREADERKMEVRRTIAKLRRQFKKLLEKNQELPSHLQLQRKVYHSCVICVYVRILFDVFPLLLHKKLAQKKQTHVWWSQFYIMHTTF